MTDLSPDEFPTFRDNGFNMIDFNVVQPNANPDKCYCCPRKPTGQRCVDCDGFYCDNHKGDAEESPGEWKLCDWCWEVRYAK